MSISTDGHKRGALAALAILLLALGFMAGTNSRSAGADDLTLERRLQRMEDEKQIRDLSMAYGQHLDTLDFESYSQLFARKGEFSGQLSEYTTVEGPELIRSTMEKAFASRTYDPDHVTNVHLVSNLRIEVGEERATGYSKWTVLSRNERGEPYVRVSGHYDDVYMREDGRWKFLSRVARREIP